MSRTTVLFVGRAPILADVLDMSLVSGDDGAPECISLIPSPRIRRQVWLRTDAGLRLCYAVSWWLASDADGFLQNRSLPIWSSLAQRRIELYRDIRGWPLRTIRADKITYFVCR